MIRYVVQARTQKASEAQAGLEREAVEAEKARARAAKQLERVQQQMEEFIAPVNYSLNTISTSMWYAAHKLGLEGHSSTYGTEFVHPTKLPDVAVLYAGNPKNWKTLVSKPYFRLPPSDLAVLCEDPAKRQRWAALFTHTVMPSLRMLAEIIPNKVRIAPPSHPISSCCSRCVLRADAPARIHGAGRAQRDAARRLPNGVRLD
jgi:hypothetical protein